MRKLLAAMVLLNVSVAACADDAPAPVTTSVWQEAVVSVLDLDQSAQFFTAIGGFEEKWRGPVHASEIAAWGLPESASGEALLIGPAGLDDGLIRLVRFDNAGRQEPTRPGARAWDTGCYFSIMARMKGMQSIYADALRLGWWSETPITELHFGDSHLNVMVFVGPAGLQVQGYERLSLPLPEGFPAFERISGPFNMMQMVRDRDAAYAFYTGVLGFDTFYRGEPYVSPKPVTMPLGIPRSLTTTVRYRAGIVYPVAGERGRMETIEIMDLEGHDYATRCDAPNLGILAVRFPVEDVAAAASTIAARDWPLATERTQLLVQPYGELDMIGVKTPDGANIHFFATTGSD